MNGIRDNIANHQVCLDIISNVQVKLVNRIQYVVAVNALIIVSRVTKTIVRTVHTVQISCVSMENVH